MTPQPHHPATRLVQKLQACDFKIKAVDPVQDCSRITQLEHLVFVNELGFPKEVGKRLDEYEAISARFIALFGDTPVGTLRLVNPQLGNRNTTARDATLPIETFVNIKPITKGEPAMEISEFMVLPEYRHRAFCSAMMACCLAYAEQNTIAYAFATTVPNTNDPFERLGLRAFAKPFFNTTCHTQTTPRAIDLHAGRSLLGELTGQLQEAKVIP
jgi:Acetyltransferase (GNAT) domain